jgi:hypothetical protein
MYPVYRRKHYSRYAIARYIIRKNRLKRAITYKHYSHKKHKKTPKKKHLSHKRIPKIRKKSIKKPINRQNIRVTQEYTRQIDSCSCGYNVLYNASALNKKYGHKARTTSLGSFKRECKKVLKSRHINFSHALYNNQMERIAKHLGLHNYTFLSLKHNEVCALPSHSISISYPSSRAHDKAYIDNLFKKAYRDYHRKEISRLKKIIEKSKKGQSVVVHFACHVTDGSEPHVILMSLVKHTNGTREIVIKDNLNVPVTSGTEAYKYLSCLKKEFGAA